VQRACHLSTFHGSAGVSPLLFSSPASAFPWFGTVRVLLVRGSVVPFFRSFGYVFQVYPAETIVAMAVGLGAVSLFLSKRYVCVDKGLYVWVSGCMCGFHVV
jgi:hypothetical protein